MMNIEMDSKNQDHLASSSPTPDITTALHEMNNDKNGSKTAKSVWEILYHVLVISLLCSIVILLVILVNHDLNDSSVSTYINDGSSLSTDESDCLSQDIDLAVQFGSQSDNRLKLYSMPNQILPGSQFFTYSYNLLQGKPPMDLLLSGNYHQIIRITFDEGMYMCCNYIIM